METDLHFSREVRIQYMIYITNMQIKSFLLGYIIMTFDIRITLNLMLIHSLAIMYM